jgi:hypothetical protein
MLGPDGTRDRPYGAAEGEGLGAVWPSSDLRSKIVPLPEGRSMTVILSLSFWMYWFWRILSVSEALSRVWPEIGRWPG